MINEIRIVNMLFSTALAAIFCLCSCTEKQPTTAPEPENLPVGFRPMSQAVWVKSGTSNSSGNGSTTAEPMFPYDNFGVWGIARQESLVYNLWGNDGLAEVVDPEHRIANKITNSTTPRVFTPTTDAYWLRGYTYNFLAIAPLNPSGLTLSNDPITTMEEQTSVANPKDKLTFTYDLSANYTAGVYDFDLLGAAAETAVTTGGYSTSQSLIFWHLLSQVKFEIAFGKDAAGEQIRGVVNEIRLSPNPSATYTITYDNSDDNHTASTGISCTPITPTTNNPKPVLRFSPNTSTVELDYISIVPQPASDLTFEIDFTITESATSTAEYKGLVFNLSIPNELEEYEPNGRYSYIMSIGSKAGITFDVSVNDWGDTITGDPIEM